VTAYQVILRDRETQTVVGYYNGAWTTDQRRALTFIGARLRKFTPPACGIAVRATPTSSRSRRSLPPTSTSANRERRDHRRRRNADPGAHDAVGEGR
jgi:hypothetical protein